MERHGPNWEQFESLSREATNCRFCFDRFGVRAPTVDLAQPRWVGNGYWNQPQRKMILLRNPGSGEGRTDGADKVMRERLRKFRDGEAGLSEVLDHQRDDMPLWGRGRFRRYIVDGLRLKLDDIAIANVAWCATAGNKCPTAMLNACLDRFTCRLLALLRPNIIVCCGGEVSKFKSAIASAAPGARIIRALHYAHRKGDAAQSEDLNRVRREICGEPV